LQLFYFQENVLEPESGEEQLGGQDAANVEEASKATTEGDFFCCSWCKQAAGSSPDACDGAIRAQTEAELILRSVSSTRCHRT